MASALLRSSTLAAGSTVKMFSPDTNSGVIAMTGISSDMRIPLVGARTATGVGLGAAAGTPAGALGLAYTPGTSLTLVGEATSANAKTDACTFFVTLPLQYEDGANFSIVVNAGTSGGGTLTAASTTITVTAASIATGVVTALTVTGGAQQFGATAADLTWTVTGTGLVAGQVVIVVLTMLVTSSSGANTGAINSVALRV